MIKTCVKLLRGKENQKKQISPLQNEDDRIHGTHFIKGDHAEFTDVSYSVTFYSQNLLLTWASDANRPAHATNLQYYHAETALPFYLDGIVKWVYDVYGIAA